MPPNPPRRPKKVFSRRRVAQEFFSGSTFPKTKILDRTLFLVISRQSSEMAARTTFPKKDGKICALVPQEARAWAGTSLEININSRSLRKMPYISCKIHLRLDENGCTLRPRPKGNHILIMKKVLINYKLRDCKQLT